VLIAAETIAIQGAPDWVNAALALATPILLILAAWWFKLKREKILKEMENEDLTRRERLELRFKEFALMRAAAFVEKDLIALANSLLKGKSNGEGEQSLSTRAKNGLYDLREKLIKEAIEYFSTDDVDILAELGEARLKDIIEWAANKVSPFPGKPTVEALLSGGAERLVADGAAFLKEKMES
jgi:hypothetical protein